MKWELGFEKREMGRDMKARPPGGIGAGRILKNRMIYDDGASFFLVQIFFFFFFLPLISFFFLLDVWDGVSEFVLLLQLIPKLDTSLSLRWIMIPRSEDHRYLLRQRPR